MPTYDIAPAEVKRLGAEVMEKYHGELHKCNVKIDYMFAFASVSDSGQERGYAISLHGYRCAAVVRKISLKDRVAGRGDAEITIDAAQWGEKCDEEKIALLDHELNHLEVVKDKKAGGFKYDDAGRPKLRIRLHDHQFGWFDSVVRRHGKHSAEADQAYGFIAGPLKQLWLPYLDESDDLRIVFEGVGGSKKKRGKDASVKDE